MARVRPGLPARGSKSGRPIMALLDLLGRRWTLRILWELRDGEPRNFRELAERCDRMSPTVQNRRLAELREAQIVAHEDGGGYRLTAEGGRLVSALMPMHHWAEAWAKRTAKR